MIHELVNLGLVTVGPFVAVGATAKVALWFAYRDAPVVQPKQPGTRRLVDDPSYIRARASVAERKPRPQPALVGEVLPARRELEAGDAR
jgi:hypothetical protein